MPAISRRLMGGWTELHEAAAAGDLARLRRAVQKSPGDLDKVNRDRQTALHLASEKGFEPVLGELLDRQAKTALQDLAGRTPLHIAAMAGHAGCVSLLLGHRNREPPAEKARLLGLRDGEGRDALLAAVVAGKTESVEALLRHGADAARCMDQSGCGLMVVAVLHGQSHLLQLLAPLCGLEQRDPASGGTALHVATSKGLLDIVAWLLRAGASTTTRDNRGQTAAEVAHAAGQVAVYRLLKEAATAGAGAAPQAAGAAASGGGVGAGPQASSGVSCHNLYEVRPARLSAGACTTPWQAAAAQPPAPGQQQPLTGMGPDGPPAAVAGSQLSIPDQPPPTVYYPKTPEGAGVYY